VVIVKGICFLVIGFALVVSYQSNPLGTILIGGVAMLIYIYIKSHKNRISGKSSGLLFQKGNATVSSPTNDLMTLLMIQTILDRGSQRDNPPTNEINAEKEAMESLKHEVLALFEED